MITSASMASHPTASNFLCSRRSESISTSSSDFAASSTVLVASTSSRVPSSQTSLPPSLVSMPPLASLISPITLLVGFQHTARRGHPVSLRLPVQPPHSVGLLSGSVPLVASSQHFVPLSSVPIDFPPVKRLLEHETATVSIDSITADVQPLPHYFVGSPTRVAVFNDLPPSFDLHD